MQSRNRPSLARGGEYRRDSIGGIMSVRRLTSGSTSTSVNKCGSIGSVIFRTSTVGTETGQRFSNVTGPASLVRGPTQTRQKYHSLGAGPGHAMQDCSGLMSLMWLVPAALLSSNDSLLCTSAHPESP